MPLGFRRPEESGSADPGGGPLPSRWWHEKQDDDVYPGRCAVARAMLVKLVPAVNTGLVGGVSLSAGITVVVGRRPSIPPDPRGQSYVVGGLYPTSELKSASKRTLPATKLESSGSEMFGMCCA